MGNENNGFNAVMMRKRNLARLEAEVIAKAKASEAVERAEVKDRINEFVGEMGNKSNGLDAVMARNQKLAKLEAEVVEKAKAADAAIALAREVLSNPNKSM